MKNGKKFAWPRRLIVFLALGWILPCCTTTPPTPAKPPTVFATRVENTPFPYFTETSMPPTRPPPQSHTLEEVDAAYQIVENSSFDTGTDPWQGRIGAFTRTISDYYTVPGAAKIITSGTDNVGVAGQCAEIRDISNDWPGDAGEKRITFDAYLKTDSNISTVSLIIIFHQADCSQPGQLHVQVGTIQSNPLPGDQSWTHLSSSGLIPTDAVSADILIWAVGKFDTAQVLFDDVRTYPQAQD